MEETRKQEFLKEFDNDHKQVTVAVMLPGCEEPEYIINTKVNFKAKQKYYDTAYDDDLCLKANKEIKILFYKFN